MIVKQHPALDGVLVREDGCICLPATARRKEPVWTFGYKKRSGYMQLVIGHTTYLVHRLVAEAFIQFPIPKDLQVDHINRIPYDNRTENIRLVTPSVNCRNTAQHDRVEERDHAHTYDDPKTYRHNRNARLYADPEYRSKVLERNHKYFKENPQRQREYNRKYHASERGQEKARLRRERFSQTHRRVRCSDGKAHWVTTEQYQELMALPAKLRTPPKNN